MYTFHFVVAAISTIFMLGAHAVFMFSSYILWRKGFAEGTGEYAQKRQKDKKEATKAKYLPAAAGICVGLNSIYWIFFDNADAPITRSTSSYGDFRSRSSISVAGFIAIVPTIKGLLAFVFVYGIGCLCFSRWKIGQCVAIVVILIDHLL